ncbi:LemA family protein [Candidatus Falkowbacteria bacterium]|jgi:LemA protein|nr:LemA family protein [Elusimicrobiaceae bacterium]MBT4433522.1 LemA family protein [Candidatus Falkowbacteria bacterium]
MENLILWIVLGVIAVVALWLVAVYNGLIKNKNQTEEAWSDIDVQLKRRHNLIPNLIETVKGYATHERELFERVTEARSNAMNAGSAEEKGKAENMLTDTLKSLFAVAENYPDLKASENFAKLQDELSDTENKIQASRRFYNSNARDFNIKLQVFPTNMIAKKLGFTKKDFFEIEDKKEKEVPTVKF